MPSLDDLKKRIKSVKSTQKITKAMKMVAAAKLRKAQENAEKGRPYSQKMQNIILNLTKSINDYENAPKLLVGTGNDKTYLCVVLTADRGLCGGFNNNVVKEIKKTISSNPENNYSVLAVGKKVFEAFKKSDFINKSDHIPSEAQSIWDSLNYENSIEITNKLISAFKNNEFDKAFIIYNSFKNAAVQTIKNEPFLPVNQPDNASSTNIDYIYEPDKEEILNDLIPQSLKIQFYKALLDSFASEHGARMTAMHKATDNANEMKNDLKLFYNKARQAAITNEILEIVAGAEALGG